MLNPLILNSQNATREKTMDLDSHKLMALSGPKGDCTYFSEYIQVNSHTLNPELYTLNPKP